MLRILALDIGDVWIGSAISDPLGITCKPYKTVTRDNVNDFLYEVVSNKNVTTIVTGIPYTMSGKEGSQATKTAFYLSIMKKALKEKGIENQIKWATWDERKTSKYALQTLSTNKRLKKPSKESKSREHSIAAAFILQGYLDNRAIYD
ncbi:Holliday junction resolvase RuvX [Candidatus Babeliales bacterium]|nr:Holliday junction resolvase RuvX [Candidatus Babeliales bacterium]